MIGSHEVQSQSELFYLVFNHVSDLRQEVLSDDAVQVPVLRRDFVLNTFGQIDPLLLCVTHQRPGPTP